MSPPPLGTSQSLKISSNARTLGNSPRNSTNTHVNGDKECEKSRGESCQSLNNQMCHMKVRDKEFHKNGKLNKSSKNSRSGMQLLPSGSRRIFDKLWIVGKGQGENRSSETSGSSNSPTSVVPGDTKSSGSSLRHRRLSIS